MRQDTWAWYRIDDTLHYLVHFLRDIALGEFEDAFVEHAYMMRWYDEDLSMALQENRVL